MTNKKPTYLDFDSSTYAWKPDIDYRSNPEKYRVGKGEQGVLICEPYKSEIGKNWRFKTESAAAESSHRIFSQFISYLNQDEFVGADMARKYLQMGFTRARRYANFTGGKKYDADNGYRLLDKGTGDPEKAKAAAIFYEKWQLAEKNSGYKDLRQEWKRKYG